MGAEYVARATPDGYTLLYGTNGTHAINRTLYANTPFDPVRDFAPVSRMTQIAALLVVNPGVPANSVAELIAYAKANPGKVFFASAGNGTTSHLAGELFKSAAQVDIVHAPYRGGALAANDLMGGHVQMMIDVMPNVLPLARSGKLRGLAVTTAARVPTATEFPTVAESGLPGFEVSAWDGVLAPAGTPAAIVDEAERGDPRGAGRSRSARRARRARRAAGRGHAGRLRAAHRRGIREMGARREAGGRQDRLNGAHDEHAGAAARSRVERGPRLPGHPLREGRGGHREDHDQPARVRNAFRPETVQEMERAFADARDDANVGVVVLTGQGRDAFCSGGDQRVRGDGGYVGADGVPRLNVLDLQRQIRTLPKPVVAMVAGYAIGGGHVLHMMCDLTIAADNARFGQTGPRVGSFDGGYGAAYMARIVGQKKAREIWFLCRQYDAQAALEMGLVNCVVPYERLEAETVQWCREMLANSPIALRCLKAALNADCDGQAGLQELAGNATLLYYMSEEGREGKNAYLEKRPPDFRKFRRLP